MSAFRDLLALHDVDLMLDAAADVERGSRLKRVGLRVESIDSLRRARGRLIDRVEERWLLPYERARGRYGQGLVAVRERVCQGCWITLPTSAAPPGPGTITVCESCGRLLYWR